MQFNWLKDHMMEVLSGERWRKRGGGIANLFFLEVGGGGCWPCRGHKGLRPVGYWCLSGIPQQRASILIYSHQLTAKNDQWWQNRAVCWANAGCLFPLSCFITAIFNISHSPWLVQPSICFCTSFYFVFHARFSRVLQQTGWRFDSRWHVWDCYTHSHTPSLNRWSGMVCLAAHLVGGLIEP